MIKKNIKRIVIHSMIFFHAFLTPVFIFSSCASDKYLVEEEIYKTKLYIGRYVASHPLTKSTQIETDQAFFTVTGAPDVPENALCYIRVVRDFRFHPDIRWRLNEQYFTWEGTTEEFRLTRNLNIQ